ncbi:MAG TPA: serine/threonine-protein kinase [Vicinamibacteria bacterium]|nr:serine/threonine-protein kinase [Anaeromyxobacteraceae bacterium]HXK12743.1 serine/threonine-protein kinase [Vicinamibacteria bacterium]
MERVASFGPFEVRGEVGHGTGGVVYVAWDAEHDRTVAVKVYTSAPRNAAAASARLRRDAQAAGALGHPNIAAVLGVGEHEGQPWVATEFISGVSLTQVLRSHAPMPIERVLDVWRQLCEGLAHAHREGVFHLDLKPADVRLTPAGEVKIVDFGSWHLKALERKGPGPIEEGLHYRAPEILAGRRPDRGVDVFAVAAIVYELVSFRKAFAGDSTTDVVRSLTRGEPDLACLPRTPFTPAFERVLAASLAHSPEKRHSSFEEVHADLVQLVRDVAPRLRSAAERTSPGPPEREELLAAITRARAEDRLEDALEGCRKLLDLDADDEAARRSMSEIESVLIDREVDGLVGMALAYAADGEFALATQIAEKVERLAPWSPRYLRLQVYLDEEGAKRKAEGLLAAAREHRAEGRLTEARTAAQEALSAMPGHPVATGFLAELDRTQAPAAAVPGPPEPPAATPPATPRPAPRPEPSPRLEAAAPAEKAAPARPPTFRPAAAPAPAPGPAAPTPAPRAAPAPKPAPRSATPPQPAPAAPAPAARGAQGAAEATALSAAALQHFLKDDHKRAREAVERALALDPSNRRAQELQKILRVLG